MKVRMSTSITAIVGIRDYNIKNMCVRVAIMNVTSQPGYMYQNKMTANAVLKDNIWAQTDLCSTLAIYINILALQKEIHQRKLFQAVAFDSMQEPS